MLLLILLILIARPSPSTNAYTYGIIRNASIKLPFPLPNTHSHQLFVDVCSECLCEAGRHTDKVYLFTCTEHSSRFLCEFYYFMPKHDEIDYPRTDASIYLMRNETFEEKDDCCNTTFLVQKIQRASPGVKIIGGESRFLVFVDNHTISSINDKQVRKFNRANMSNIPILSPPSGTTIGYSDGMYYVNEGNNIAVYNEMLATPVYRISLNQGTLTTIRFLNATQMLVGVGDNKRGVYIFEKASRGDQFKNGAHISGTEIQQVHAIGIVDENSFYVGWDATYKNIALYKRDANNKWQSDPASTIPYAEPTSDIFVDQCQRVWVVEANKNRIFVYDSNRGNRHNITVGAGVFNLLILEDQNYTLITSHSDGIYRIQPTAVNCRPQRK